MGNNAIRLVALTAVLLAALPAGAGDILIYADKEGGMHSAQVVSVRKDEEDDFSARIISGTRKRSLSIPSRLVVSFRRGDPDAENQWEKKLATGLRLLAVGRLANEGTNPGAEETFVKVAYTTEKGIKGEEAEYAVQPWHNMYAVYYLIETRYRMGLAGDQAKLKAALGNVEEFKKRTDTRSKKTLDWEVPAEQGTTRTGKVYGWGDSRLLPEVMLYEARIHRALKDKAKAAEAFDTLIDRIKKKNLSPELLTAAYIEKAELDAEGQSTDKQEEVFRSAGTVLANLVRSQPDDYGKGVVARAANRVLLRGADLLLESAAKKAITYDMPLQRYQTLKAGPGRSDPALRVGAETGIGICLTEKGQGEPAYKALLEVVARGSDYPEHMARAMYYLSKAAQQFAGEIDSAGGKGDFLRAESERWLIDLKERYPTSDWAKKAQ